MLAARGRARKLSAVHPLPCLDDAALAKLLKLGGPKFAGNMVEIFLGYAPTKLAEAQAAEAKGDYAGIEDAMHPLKTSASHVGALAVRALAVEIEQQVHAGERARIPELLAELEEEMDAVKPLLLEKRAALDKG